MKKYYEKLTLPIVFLGLLSSGAYADAGTLGKPVSQLNLRDTMKAAVAVVLCNAETEVADVVRIELVTVEVDGKTKQVYRPVNTEKAEVQQPKD